MTDKRETENITLDGLAFHYSKTKCKETLNKLLNEMIPICKRDAKSWAYRTGIPEHDLFSVYLEAVQEAAEDFKPVGLFIKRYHHFKNRKGADVLKYYRYQKRDLFKTLSLNTRLNDDEEDAGAEFVDTVADITSEFAEAIELKCLIEQFKEKSPQHAQIIEMLANGEANESIAESLGQNEYNAFARKKVSVARKQFKKYIQ